MWLPEEKSMELLLKASRYVVAHISGSRTRRIIRGVDMVYESEETLTSYNLCFRWKKCANHEPNFDFKSNADRLAKAIDAGRIKTEGSYIAKVEFERWYISNNVGVPQSWK